MPVLLHGVLAPGCNLPPSNSPVLPQGRSLHSPSALCCYLIQAKKTLCCNCLHSGLWKAVLEFFFFPPDLDQTLLIKLIRCALNINSFFGSSSSSRVDAVVTS